MKKLLRGLLGLGLFLLLANPIKAAEIVTVDNQPTTATIGESIILNVTLSNFTPSSQYYAKFRIGPTSSSLNDGETFNNSSWFSDSSGYSNFPVVTLDASGSASFQLIGRAKISLAQSGSNIFVIRTALVSNTDNKNDSQEYAISLTAAPTPTPTTTPTNTPSLAHTPSNTPAPTVTSTSAPSPTSAVSPPRMSTKIPTKTPSPTPVPTLDDSASVSGNILGVIDTVIPTPEMEVVENPNSSRPLIISFSFIGAGLALLAGLLAWKKYKMIKNIHEDS